uniref:LRRCT domain-containing protein n=1 Tax=Bracon brevicornis TaxID=1563983 RepID=A0A6V7ILS1_9HYME
MNLLILILFLHLSSITAGEERCEAVGSIYDLCKIGNVVTRLVEISSSEWYTDPLPLIFFDNATIKANALSKTNIKSLKLESIFSWSEEHQDIFTLFLESKSLASSTLSSLYLRNINLNLTEGRLEGLNAVTKLTIENSWTNKLPTELFPFFPNLQELIIYHHRLPVIPAQSFVHLKALKHLKIQGYTLREPPVITRLEPGCLDGLENLEKLTVLLMILESLPPVFDQLTNLKSLKLSHCHNSPTIDARIFQNLSTLTDLELSFGRLETLERGIFENLPHLKTIKLKQNHLTTIPHGLFNGLTELETINLDHNNISMIKTGAFSGLNLNLLKMCYTFSRKGVEFEPGAFNGLTVVELDLTINSLSHLSPKTFDGLNATTVDLKINDLTKIKADYFFGLETKNLDLSYNKLEEIEPLSFKYTQIQFLNLTSNMIKYGNKSVWGLDETVEVVGVGVLG